MIKYYFLLSVLTRWRSLSIKGPVAAQQHTVVTVRQTGSKLGVYDLEEKYYLLQIYKTIKQESNVSCWK